MVARLTLRVALAPYPHVQGLRDGTVRSDRVEFQFIPVEPITRAFRRMARGLEFDLCEMAITTLAQAIAVGKPILGLSAVVMRGFHHGALVCRRNAPVGDPAALAAGRIGVRAWSQTTGVWVRGILRHDYGLDPSAMHWITEEDAHVAEYQDPPFVERATGPLPRLLLEERIDAAIALRGVPAEAVRPVIAEPDAAAAAWFGRHGIYPVNHALAIRRELLDDHPWLAGELMALFAQAQDAARPPPHPIAGEALPYGLAANRRAIETLCRYAAEQGLIPRACAAEELFAA